MLLHVRRRLYAALALCTLTVSASAHSHPKTMVPAADAVVSAPAQLSIVFTEPLEPKFSKLELKDAKGTLLSKQAAVVDPADPKHITLALPRLTAGVYHVHWISASTDGHHMDGDYSFTVK